MDRVQAVIRFSRLALPVVGVLAATGLNRALDLAGGWSGLIDTGFGPSASYYAWEAAGRPVHAVKKL